jgi:hypothetical protein
MPQLSNRVARLEKERKKKTSSAIVFDVQLVDEITPEMRTEAEQARRAGEKHYNVEYTDEDQD